MILQIHIFRVTALVELGKVVVKFDICLLYEKMKKTAAIFSDVGICPLEMYLLHLFWMFNYN